MGNHGQAPAEPTSRQLAYIRDLNSRTGTDFAYPGTTGLARQEIERLTRLAERQNLAIARFTAITEAAGLPMFDAVQRDPTTVRFLWNNRKVIVVIDLDDDPTDPACVEITDDTATAA